MFFQEGTPDTSGYMIAGYAIAFLVMVLYVASIYLRTRNLNQDLTVLEEMEEPAPPVKVRTVNPTPKSPAPSANNKSAKPVTKRSKRK